jgi:hypothetical protein
MLSRIVYRIVSVFFFLAAIVCWIMAALCVVGLIARPDPDFLWLGLWSGVLAFFMGGASKDAWRAGRYDPLYHDYP